MSNFKRGKHTEKTIEWRTPKEYQKPIDVVKEQLTDLMDIVDDIKSTVIRKKPPKAKVCRKTKGPHVFGIWSETKFAWSKKDHSGFWERRCINCNRKDTWMAPDLPGPFWKLDLNARPPGYEKQI